MGKSLTFRGAVYEAQDILRNHRCRDPICDTHLWKVRHELDMARIRIRQLEKELESHGIKPTRRYKDMFFSELIIIVHQLHYSVIILSFISKTHKIE